MVTVPKEKRNMQRKGDQGNQGSSIQRRDTVNVRTSIFVFSSLLLLATPTFTGQASANCIIIQ